MARSEDSMFISKKQQYKIERKVRRQIDIDEQTPRVRNAIHKSKKAYNRNENKRQVFYYLDND